MLKQTSVKRLTIKCSLQNFLLGLAVLVASSFTGILFNTGTTTAATNSTINFQARLLTSSGTLLDTGGSAVTNWNTCSLTPTSGHANTWLTASAGATNTPAACNIASGTWTSGGVATLRLHIQAAATTGTTQVGDIILTYLSVF